MNDLRKPLLTSGITSLLSLLILLPSAAWSDTKVAEGKVSAKHKKNRDVLITAIIIDNPSTGYALIRGENLCEKKGKERVTLGLPDASNELSTSNCIKAGSGGNALDELSVQLPSGLEQGGYLLTVHNGRKTAAMDFVYGRAAIAGEQGPVGDTGEKGDTGPVGPQGVTGLAGSDATAGGIGPQGDKGPQGEQGPQGATGLGIRGNQGPDGLRGETGPQGPQGQPGIGCTATQCSDNLATVSCGSPASSIQVACN